MLLKPKNRVGEDGEGGFRKDRPRPRSVEQRRLVMPDAVNGVGRIFEIWSCYKTR